MRSRLVLLCLALAAVPGTGCALVGDPCAAPVTGTASFVSGSVPAPYHQEWTVTLADGSGSVSWSPGYGSPERWTATFAPDPARVGEVCRALRDERDSATAPGGGTLRVRWQGDQGRSTRLTTSSSDAADLVLSAVPATSLEEVRSAYEAWARDHRR